LWAQTVTKESPLLFASNLWDLHRVSKKRTNYGLL